MNHVFWLSLYKKSKPIWLTEGLACYVGKNFVLNNHRLFKVLKKYEVKPSILEYRYMLRNFENGHYPRYPIWASFTDFLIKKKSVKTVINFMRKYAKNSRIHNYKVVFAMKNYQDGIDFVKKSGLEVEVIDADDDSDSSLINISEKHNPTKIIFDLYSTPHTYFF